MLNERWLCADEWRYKGKNLFLIATLHSALP